MSDKDQTAPALEPCPWCREYCDYKCLGSTRTPPAQAADELVERVLQLIEERLCIVWFPKENREQFADELRGQLKEQEAENKRLREELAPQAADELVERTAKQLGDANRDPNWWKYIDAAWAQLRGKPNAAVIVALKSENQTDRIKKLEAEIERLNLVVATHQLTFKGYRAQIADAEARADRAFDDAIEKCAALAKHHKMAGLYAAIRALKKGSDRG